MEISGEILLTFGIIGFGIFLFIKEYFSIDTTAIIIMALFIVTGILTPGEGFSGFNNPATITVGCMFVLSFAVFSTGLLNGVSKFLLKVGKRNIYLATFSLIFIATIFSAFINVTAIVTMFIPVVLKLAQETGINPGRLLMPLSFGALLGGVCTLVGTSTNILVSSIAESHGFDAFGMFEFSGTAIWLTGAGLLYLLTIGLWLLPKRDAEKNYQLKKSISEYVTEIRLNLNSSDIGKTSETSILESIYKAQILEVKLGEHWEIVNPFYRFSENEKVKAMVSPQSLVELRADKNYIIESEYTWQNATFGKSEQKTYEVLIPSGSLFSGKTLKELRFPELYNTIVIAIRHRKDVQTTDLENVVLHEGDMLLMLAQESVIDDLFTNNELVIISDYKVPFRRNILKATLTVLIIAAVIGTAALNITSIVISSMVGCLLLILFGIIKPQQAYEAVEWKVIFMLAGVLSMGVAIEKTGGAQLIGQNIYNLLGDFSPQLMLSFIFLLCFLATNVMSNNATAALMAPIAISIAQSMELSERPFLVAVMFASSLSFMTPMGYQTNTIIYAPGNYRFNDFVRVGTPLNILIWIIASIVIPIYFPF